MSEYDARSKPATPKFRDNYDVIFKNAKADREKRAKERQSEARPDVRDLVDSMVRGTDGG